MTGPPILVFAGPSLPSAIRPGDPCLAWRPPAAAGDLLRLLRDPPDIVCLIDGYFDWRPAPWHKEILLLIEAGTRVLGAASMGALRAAELDRHGMTGVGEIYRAYRSGMICGDDEVALVHTLEDLGWKPVSEPMVDVRATLLSAVRAGIISADAARALRDSARAIHFSERDWPAIVKLASWGGQGASGFSAWLATGIVRLKQADALRCLSSAVAERRPPSRRAAAPVPLTCFVKELAAECGVALRPSRQARAAPDP
ncbi:MAG TPA: TfuA-like protein [Allosphingosinicella sp.]|nr:TfuA-like protein [Allosphingosinicella sp.]